MNGTMLLKTSLALLLSLRAMAFDSYEHISTGTMGVNIKFPENQQTYADFPYKKAFEALLDPNNKAKVGKIEYSPTYIIVKSGEHEVKLAYGEIIALAGDFMGRLDGTISEKTELRNFESERSEVERRFELAFKALLPTPDNPIYAGGNLEYLRGLFTHEFESLILSLGKKYGVHFNNASSHSITSKVKDNLKYAKSPGYATLLELNVDHFEDDAKISYAAGHSLALKKAKEGYELFKAGKAAEAVDALNMAYAYDAFASHFLTDLFSAGHLRTPRGGLLDLTKNARFASLGYNAKMLGLMANAMHDEDNYLGLWLKNGYGQVWKAFGDGSYFDKKSEDNRAAIKEALQASVDEVWLAFKHGEIRKFKEYKALKLIGVPLPAGSDFINELVNPWPLFIRTSNWAQVRADYYDIANKNYQDVSRVTALSSFWKNDQGTFNHANFLSFLNEGNLVDSLKRKVIVECYNKFDRDSGWFFQKPQEYTLMGPDADASTVDAYEIDNKNLNFYESILVGNLRPDGVFYVVNEDKGKDIIDQCEHSMKTAHTFGKTKGADVVEIRARTERGYSHPVVKFDKDGKLIRLRGYKQESF